MKILGQGGFGKTFEVDDSGTAKVLKVLINEYPIAIALFQREAEVLSYLRHPGIPRVEPDGYFTFFPRRSKAALHCLVMEKIAGLNLEEWLHQHRDRPMAQQQAIAWLKQLVQILQEIHQQHYFHRDIKPSNIMLRSPHAPNALGGCPHDPLGNESLLAPLGKGGWGDQLVLIDFGAVREITETYKLKLEGKNVTEVMSPGFTPQEQAEGKAVPQSDFFALGRTFVYLLTGIHPIKFPQHVATNRLIWREQAPQISPSLAGLIDYLMAPLPGKRPQNAQEILWCIQEIEQNGYQR
jgi:serine/threonine protein kinase